MQPYIRTNRIRFGVHQRIETEDEVYGAGLDLVEREAVVHDVLDVLIVGKA
jgi:hypothetical protein